MNYKTNFYGAIGLASTIGKHGFALGQNASWLGAGACYYTRQVVEVNVLGYNAFENLEKASKWSEKKCKSATASCQEWETWAQQKFEKAKKQEELENDWKSLNKKHAFAYAPLKEFKRTNMPPRISKVWIKQVYSKNYHQFLFNNLFTKTF